MGKIQSAVNTAMATVMGGKGVKAVQDIKTEGKIMAEKMEKYAMAHDENIREAAQFKAATEAKLKGNQKEAYMEKLAGKEAYMKTQSIAEQQKVLVQKLGDKK